MTPVLHRLPARGAARRGPSLLHPECPIEQALWSADEVVQAGLMQEIWRREAFVADGVLLVADPKSLRVLARCEAALRRPVAALRERHGDTVVVEAPAVRYAHGAPVLTRVESDRDPFVLEADAPLADLLGFGDWLDAHASGVEASIWLSRYRPIGGDGPRAA